MQIQNLIQLFAYYFFTLVISYFKKTDVLAGGYTYRDW